MATITASALLARLGTAQAVVKAQSRDADAIRLAVMSPDAETDLREAARTFTTDLLWPEQGWEHLGNGHATVSGAMSTIMDNEEVAGALVRSIAERIAAQNREQMTASANRVQTEVDTLKALLKSCAEELESLRNEAISLLSGASGSRRR